MPELPEVETIRSQLQRAVVGKTIIRVEVLDKKIFIGEPKKVNGAKITRVERVAKVLRILLDNGNALFIHFKLNGQFFLETPEKKLERRFTRVVLRLDDGSNLVFNDSRKFAWMKVVEPGNEPASGAIEPFRKDFTLENFSNILAKTRRPVKVLLMDQDKIGGIGNIYANESLFAARIDPFRPANSLDKREAKRLHEAILKILKKAIECFGSSGKDEWYRQLDGKTGCYQEHFLVYQRNGGKCPGACGGEVLRKKQSGRSTFYFPQCQK